MNKIYVVMETRTTWEHGDNNTAIIASEDRALCEEVVLTMREKWKQLRTDAERDYSLHYWITSVPFTADIHEVDLDDLSDWME